MKRTALFAAVLTSCSLLLACSPDTTTRTEAEVTAPAGTPAEPAPVDSTPAPQPVSQEALAGQFSGTLPCASCPGIDTKLTLSADGSFVLEETYQEQEDGEFKIEGKWSTNDQGHLLLNPEGVDHSPREYRIDDANSLRQLGENNIDPGADYTLRRN